MYYHTINDSCVGKQ